MLIRLLIISIISSITILLPISYESHISLLKQLFNTKIFDNSLLLNSLYLSFPIFILIINLKNIPLLTKYIIKKDKRKTTIKYLLTTTISTILITLIHLFIPNISISVKYLGIFFIITSFIILLSTNKKGIKKHNEISYLNALIYPIFQIITIIPTISPLCANLLASKILKLNKETALTISTISLIPLYFIKSISSIFKIIEDETLLFSTLFCLFIIVLLLFPIYNYFKNYYNKNKLYKLSIYCLILGISIIIWFR